MTGSEAGDATAPTHLAVPVPLALRLAAYLKDPKFNFDQAVEILAGLAASPPIHIDAAAAGHSAETT